MACSTDKTIKGRVYVLGDNVDTDQIIPAQYLNLVPTIPAELEKLGSYALSGLPDSYPAFVKPGCVKSGFTIIVAGRNFGCGSSREHAPVALAAAGVRAVIAGSYARIFFRNAIATGMLYPCESPADLCSAFATGQEAEIDFEKSLVTNCLTNAVFDLAPLGAAAEVIEAGGLFNYARRHGMIRAAGVS